MRFMNRGNIKNLRRIVVKIGTSILVHKDGSFDIDKVWVRQFTNQISMLLKQGYEIILVSSGAIVAGMHLLGIAKRPHVLSEQQACAALGQGYLIHIYEEFFREKGFHAAQILLTWDDIRDSRRHLNAEHTLNMLLSKKAVPVINENDTVSVDEIKFGDNDKLSALVAKLAKADLLVILTDVEGVCVSDTMSCIDTVAEINDALRQIACGTDKECSLGGMKTKLEACGIAMDAGIVSVVANGRKKDILLDIMKGRKEGTVFIPRTKF